MVPSLVAPPPNVTVHVSQPVEMLALVAVAVNEDDVPLMPTELPCEGVKIAGSSELV
jgi:hypothetical protein